MTPQEFFTTQSPFTDPGDYQHLYKGLPSDIPALCKIVQGLLMHYVGDKALVGGTIPPERLCEVDTRYVSDILARIVEMDDRPLTEARTPENRFVGCCRDYAALTVSMLRHFGVPARTRSGFANYFFPDYYVDHVVVEYWNGGAWQLVDAQIPPAPWWGFDVTDVPRDRFVVGGLAWQMCRAGDADPKRFGLGFDGPPWGWGFIRGRLMHDLAALNKHEMLCWDEWGFANPDAELSEDDEALIDRVATATQGGDAAFEEVRALFEDPRLTVPSVVPSWSPVEDKLVEVTLRG